MEQVHIHITINQSTSNLAYTLGRTVVHAMASISKYMANWTKPSATEKLTIIWKGSGSLDLVFMGGYPLQRWF